METKRVCVFCGNKNLSKEHIFAQWLLKELGILGNDVIMTHANFAGMPISNRKHPFSKLVNGLVCEKCNNGWMSQLEGDCQQHIINLMNLNGIKTELIFLEEHYETVAKWAFKNVILLNSATNYRQLVPTKHYISLYEGNIPNGVFIDLAFSKNNPTIEWRQTPGGLVIKDKSLPFRTDASRYTITFQIKNLLIKVVFYDSEENTFYEDEGAIRLYPQFGVYGEPKMFNDIDNFDVHGVMHEYL
ncbi:hypothetical protein [Desulfosporosinus metallidurans]|uniref:HNH endonuclease n=1 Tax=Desulfosporosinus metallidurans TaxID=1888891 RepID=A0A1Q8QJV3_9FIRM|nr:hypothetical protein [Desulfosporosinus metallidurans]OLN27606.1 hypothetical protein DSOL_4481 [Desulfosporosinus metallidurans]